MRDVSSKIGNQIHTQIRGQVNGQVGDLAYIPMCSQIYGHVGDQVCDQVCDQIQVQIRAHGFKKRPDRMIQLRKEIEGPCGRVLRATVREKFKHDQKAIRRMEAIQWQHGTMLQLTTAVTSPINSRIWAEMRQLGSRT
jgi:hypothetical protein